MTKFTIDPAFFIGVTETKVWGMYDNKDPDTLTPEQLLKVIRGEDRCSSMRNIDHPEFTKLREQLEKDKYIEVQRSWWNGDRVLRPFVLNGKKFKKNEQFPCGAAMSGHLKFMK